MRLSYSELSTYRRCPRAFWYRTEQKLQRKYKSVNLYVGSAVHRMLLAHYQGGTIDQARQDLIEEASNKYTLFDNEMEKEQDLIENAYDIAMRYIYKYMTDSFVPLHVEEEFTLQLPGVVVTFTPDLVASVNDSVVIVDHKTCSRLPDERKLWTTQSLLYSAGVKQMYPELTGFYFNYIRKKHPSQPRLTVKGTISDIGRLDTDYETLYTFVHDECPPAVKQDPVVKRRLKELETTDNYFRRDFIPYREGASDKVMNEMIATAQQIKAEYMYPRTYIESGYHDCAHCEFKSLCTAELLDYDVQAVLDNEYEPREPKNVYESEGE